MPWSRVIRLFFRTFTYLIITAIIPMQDILGLGNEARMNLPGRSDGNWQFRFEWEQLTPGITRRLRELVDTYARTVPTVGDQDALTARTIRAVTDS